jgi:hypothetical protein
MQYLGLNYKKVKQRLRLRSAKNVSFPTSRSAEIGRRNQSVCRNQVFVLGSQIRMLCKHNFCAISEEICPMGYGSWDTVFRVWKVPVGRGMRYLVNFLTTIKMYVPLFLLNIFVQIVIKIMAKHNR